MIATHGKNGSGGGGALSGNGQRMRPKSAMPNRRVENRGHRNGGLGSGAPPPSGGNDIFAASTHAIINGYNYPVPSTMAAN